MCEGMGRGLGSAWAWFLVLSPSPLSWPPWPSPALAGGMLEVHLLKEALPASPA